MNKTEALEGYLGEEIKSPSKAIRKKCLDCCCGHNDQVKLCSSYYCPLYPFRLGKNPYSTRKPMPEEKKQALVERMRSARKDISR